MTAILVSGLINIETTVRVDAFPIHYEPVRYPFFGIQSRVSGVGYNIARALTILGDSVRLLAMIGRDPAGRLVREALAADRISADLVLSSLTQTPQAAILYDATGQRLINTDLKDIQEQCYPADLFEQALRKSTVAVLCNINFSRPFLRIARDLGRLVATDVHAIADLNDPYNADFMQAADVLFMSDERLPCSPEEWVQALWERYGTPVAVVGLGSRGALLGLRKEKRLERLPAVYTRPVVSTIGAGDALFSAFLHFYVQDRDADTALRRAIVFASYKIGEASAAEGFLDEAQLAEWCQRLEAVRASSGADKPELRPNLKTS